MGTLEVELEEQMYDQDFGMEDEESFIESDESSSSGEIETPQIDLMDYSETSVTPPSNDVVDELLGEEEDIDLDDLSDLADDFDLDDLDDLAEGLNDADDDIDTSFIDEIL
jgi:hypothetical protein